MPQFTDSLTLRAGATPQDFDGAGIFRFNSKARRVTGLSVSHSLSAPTTDEGLVMAAKLSNNVGLGSKNPVFFMGFCLNSPPTTNGSVQTVPVDYMPLNIPISGNETMQIDITTVAGAIQTGTHDTRWTIHYDENDTPADILAAKAGSKGVVPVRGGTYGYATALATTNETELTGSGSTLNIPAEAKEIVAITVLQIIDTAVTAEEEIGGHARLEFSGIDNAGKQEYPSNGGLPGLGTEVDVGAAVLINYLPMYLKGTGQELQTSVFVNALSAITGGADWAVNILWR